MQFTNQEPKVSTPVNILKNYNFESTNLSYEEVLDSWLQRFPLDWVNLALVESLHQGRYKVISVEQILTLWQRRGKPSYHFNHDFQRLVSNNLPQPLHIEEEQKPPQAPASTTQSFSRPRSVPTNFIAQSWAPISEFPVNAQTTESAPTEKQGFKDDIEILQELASQHSENIESSNKEDLQNSVESTEAPRIETEMESISCDDKAEFIDQFSHSSFVDSQQAMTEVLSFEPVSQESSAEEFHIHPIDQFVPQTETSEFCAKLTAMAQVSV